MTETWCEQLAQSHYMKQNSWESHRWSLGLRINQYTSSRHTVVWLIYNSYMWNKLWEFIIFSQPWLEPLSTAACLVWWLWIELMSWNVFQKHSLSARITARLKAILRTCSIHCWITIPVIFCLFTTNSVNRIAVDISIVLTKVNVEFFPRWSFSLWLKSDLPFLYFT